MAYLAIQDFKYGMDRRRRRLSGVPGTLWKGENCVITRGGDVERARKFVSTFSLPAGTFGMAHLREQPYFFGSADLAASMPVGTQYQRLQSPASAAMTKVLDVKTFDGALYVIAEYDDGNVHHFYDGSRVTGWDTVADSNADFETLADYLALKIDADDAVRASAYGTTIEITAEVAGTDFTIAKSTVDNGGTNDQDITLTTVQANVAEVAEVQATGTVTVTGGTRSAGINKIDDITVDGTSLFANPVNWILSNADTAAAVVTEINNNTGTHGYTAAAVGAVVTITAAVGTGATENGNVVAADIPGTSDVTVSTANMASGVTYVAPVAKVVTAAISGTFESTDQFTITINGTDYVATPRGAATGTSLYITLGRVYSPSGSVVRYCVIDDPTDWTTTTTSSDAGFFSVATAAGDSERVVALADYNTQTAIFTTQSIFIYTLSANDTENSLSSVIRNTGTRSPRSVVAFGNRDVFYLNESGVRSLRARDSSGAAQVDDVGTVVDQFVQEWLTSAGDQVARDAVATLEPRADQLFVAAGTRVFVFSRYPTAKIAAWTYLSPGFTVSDMMRANRSLYVRGGDTVYIYGGRDGDTWPAANELPVTVETPYMSAEGEADIKKITGYDQGAENSWTVKLLPNPEDDTEEISVGVVHGTTYAKPDIHVPARTSHFALKLTCAKAGRASLDSLAIHFEKVRQS